MSQERPRAAAPLRAIRSRTFTTMVLLVVAFVGTMCGADLRPTVKKQSISVRLIGRASSLPLTSFGANYESYVGTLQTKANGLALVKLVYRFMNYQPRFPGSLADHDLVHSFRATRQPDCDERAESIIYSRQVGPAGQTSEPTFSFVYAKNASGISIPPSAVLPCYVVSADDYKGTRSLPVGQADPVAADKQPLGASR